MVAPPPPDAKCPQCGDTNHFHVDREKFYAVVEGRPPKGEVSYMCNRCGWYGPQKDIDWEHHWPPDGVMY